MLYRLQTGVTFRLIDVRSRAAWRDEPPYECDDQLIVLEAVSCCLQAARHFGVLVPLQTRSHSPFLLDNFCKKTNFGIADGWAACLVLLSQKVADVAVQVSPVKLSLFSGH
jgi:hypothetical protein